MIDISDNERRRAFSTWLRTGRLPSAGSVDGIELKFNPWHDPDTGRFTFAGAGRHYGEWRGGGATGSWDRPAQSPRPKFRKPESRATANDADRAASRSRHATSSKPSTRAKWTRGEFTGSGGVFGGGGASGAWEASESTRRSASRRDAAAAIVSSDHAATENTPAARSASAPGEQFRTVIRYGYSYQIDERQRTRRVSGALTVAGVPVRSRLSQRQAGGADRRVGDDGGHYIAARFNGPAEAFNHFAQNANFNRGAYRLLEDEWARDKRAGRAVTVKIVPQFDGGSSRPSMINVWWTVDNKRKSIGFSNERSERSHGRR